MNKADILSAIDKKAIYNNDNDNDLYDFGPTIKSNNNSKKNRIKDAQITDFQSGFTILLNELPEYEKDKNNSYYIDLYNEMHKDTIDKNEGKIINGGNKTQRNKNKNKRYKNKKGHYRTIKK